jgi:hypothetical protein
MFGTARLCPPPHMQADEGPHALPRRVGGTDSDPYAVTMQGFCGGVLLARQPAGSALVRRAVHHRSGLVCISSRWHTHPQPPPDIHDPPPPRFLFLAPSFICSSNWSSYFRDAKGSVAIRGGKSKQASCTTRGKPQTMHQQPKHLQLLHLCYHPPTTNLIHKPPTNLHSSPPTLKRRLGLALGSKGPLLVAASGWRWPHTWPCTRPCF